MSQLKLLNIVESVILCENRIDDAERLAGSLGVKTHFNTIKDISERVEPKHKYINWITSNFHDIIKDAESAIELLTFFDRNPKKFKVKDINAYKTYNELEHAVLEASNQRRREVPIIEGTRVIYDDDAFVVVVPETHKSSCYYGAGSTWCTTQRDNSSFFRDYRQAGELYYIISRTKPSSDPTYKMAVRFVFDDGSHFPPQSKIAEIRNAKNELISEDVLNKNSSANVTTVVTEDFKTRWDEWWNEMAEEIKKRKKEENEKEAAERIKRERQAAIERQREAVRRLERRNEAQRRREEGEYEDNEKAHALRQYLIEEGEMEGGDEEEVARISAEIEVVNQKIAAITDRIGEVTDDMRNNPAYEDQIITLDDLQSELNDLEDELTAAGGEDVYELYEEGYEHYGLTIFSYGDKQWAIGDDDEADKAAHDQVENFIEEFKGQPGMGFSPGFIDSYIDGDKIVSDWEDSFDNWVRESPDSYIKGDPEQLTDEGEKKLEEAKEKQNDLENKKSELEEKISDMERQLEDLDPDSDEYTELDSELDSERSELSDIESQLEDIEVEISDIEDGTDYKEFSEEQIEDAIESIKNDWRDDPVGELKALGMDEDLTRYVDEEDLIKGVIEADGRGNGISGYDGHENETSYNGTTYFIYRTN